MRVLIGGERSGVTREAFRALGHEAYSCDLEPAEDGSAFHIQGDALEVAARELWHLFIGHPTCTYVCGSGLHWNKRRPERAALTEAAIEDARRWMAVPVDRVCIENPVGILSTAIRKPDQIIQPYQFGEDASKATCLWLKNLPRLRPTQFVEPRMVDGKPRWSNQTDSGQNRLAPSAHRWMDRSRTYPGIAAAMAEQFGIQGATQQSRLAA